MTTFCYVQIETIAYGRYCLPKEPLNKAAVDNYLSKLQHIVKRIAGDLEQVFACDFLIKQSLDVMCFGGILTLALAVTFFLYLRKPEKIKYVIWTSIWGSFLALGALAYYCWAEYRRVYLYKHLTALEYFGSMHPRHRQTWMWWGQSTFLQSNIFLHYNELDRILDLLSSSPGLHGYFCKNFQ